VRFLTHENVGFGPITLPEQDLHTTAFWVAYEPAAVAGLSRAELETALLGLCAALHQAACLLCMCDPRDLGTHAEVRGAAGPAQTGEPESPLARPGVREPQEYVAGWRPRRGAEEEGPASGSPTAYLYDSVPGGVGFAERCHERWQELFDTAARIVDGCECAAGCPSCTGPAPDGVDGRAATRRLLDAAIARSG
jgi:DEAD/DEAH box helicase domain-containing protein